MMPAKFLRRATRSPILRAALFAAACSVFPAWDARGATATWTGLGANDNFSTAGNWSSLPASGTATDYVFSGATRLTPQVSGTDWWASSITFAAGAGAFTIGPAGSPTSNRFIMSNSAAITQSSSSSQTVNATIYLGVDGIVAGAGSGTLTLNSIRFDGTAGRTLSVNRDATIGTLINSGANGGVISVGATVPGGSTVATFSSENTGASLSKLLLNTLTGNNITVQSSSATGFTTSAAVTSDSVTFGGTNAMTFTGNFDLNGSVDNKTLAFTNTGGTTLSGTTIQLGAVNGTGSRTATLAVGANATATLSGTVTGSASSGTTGIAKTGSGTLVLANANNYNGPTLVSAGTLLVRNTSGSGTGSGALTVTAGGFGGTGIVAPNNANVSIQGGSLFVGNIGDQTGTGIVDLTFSKAGGTSAFSLASGVVVRLDIWGVGNYEKFVFDSGSAAFSTVNLAGATLEVDSPFSGWASGQSFDLFDWGTAPGTLFSSTLILPALGGGLSWDTGALYSTGVVTVVPEPGVSILAVSGLIFLLGFRMVRGQAIARGSQGPGLPA